MSSPSNGETMAILVEDVPVIMPELPPTLRVYTAQQFKAIGDTTRSRILDIIKHEPLTASQLGKRLGMPPSTIGHHLQVLEAAGLAQIVALRLVRGIVAKYYTRTARLFLFDFPPEVTPIMENTLNFLTNASRELVDTLTTDEDADCKTGFPHARISRERAAEFLKRLEELTYDFATEPPDPNGQVYGLCTAFFVSPPYLQSNYSPSTPTENE